MTQRSKAIVYICCYAAPFFILLAGCSQKDDVQRVREVIQKGAELAEQKHINALLEATSENFIAQPGGYDKRSVKGVLFAAFRHYGRFEIHFPRPMVDVATDGNNAASTVYFLIVRQDRAIPGLRELYENPQGWLEAVGDKADLYQLALEWVKVDGQWLVKEAYLEGFRGFSGRG